MELTRRELIIGGSRIGGGLLANAALSAYALESTATTNVQGRATYSSFQPGRMWLDTAGKPIHAHGGSILYVDGVFYWYGENKEGFVPGSGQWQFGVRSYSSTDLYNWKDLGPIIPASTNDPSSPLNTTSRAERPHILYNKRTKKYVCWLKLIEKTGQQTRTILTSDHFTGPYTLVRGELKLLGMSAGDFDLVVSPSDGKAYQYFERIHSEIICADLTDDYTELIGYYSTHFPHAHPPYVREGPAYFFRKGRHYLATSGTTGYYPNPSEIAMADTFHGPWTVLGDLHPEDKSRSSFNSQVCSVFKHPAKKDLYIALADRWIPDLTERMNPQFASGDVYRAMESALNKVYSGGQLSDAEKASLAPLIHEPNTALSRYVWLPIRFDGDHPAIEWKSEWKLEDYA